MSAYLHPDGASAVNGYGQKILSHIGPITLEEGKDPFPSERHVSAEVTDKDIVGEPEFNHVDIAGRAVKRIFLHDGTTYALHDEGCREARTVAERLLGMSKRLGLVAGVPFLERNIFHWARDTFRATQSLSLSAYIEEQLAGAVEKQTIWFPLAGLEVQTAFRLGPVEIRPLTANFFDAHEEFLVAQIPERSESIKSAVGHLRREVQGAAAVVVAMDAEPEHARAKGLELADAAASILRVFSTAAITPWQCCPCAVHGSEYIPKFMVIDASDDLQNFSWQHGVRDMERHLSWRMSQLEAESHLNEGLSIAGELIADEGLNGFSRRLRTALLTYSRGIATTDLNDRLVQTLSALEALLLRDNSEPIQQNLGERMAFLIEQGAEARLQVVRVLKEAYRMRSQYVHHLIPSADEKALEQFAVDAHRTLRTALGNVDRFSSHQDFIEAIDRMKFSG